MENEDKADEYLNVEHLKRHMALSVEQKLNWLEEMNEFFNETMSPESKKAREELKKMDGESRGLFLISFR